MPPQSFATLLHRFAVEGNLLPSGDQAGDESISVVATSSVRPESVDLHSVDVVIRVVRRHERDSRAVRRPDGIDHHPLPSVSFVRFEPSALMV